MPVRLTSRRWLVCGVFLIGLSLAGLWLGRLRPRTTQLMQRGISAAARGDAAGAIGLFDAVLAREPHHAQALLLRGQLAREAGNGDLAAQYWQRVPDHPAVDGSKARYLEGTLAVDRFQARHAERLLLRAAELNPDYAPPRELLLRLYVLQQRGAETRRQLGALRRLRPWSLEELILNATAHESVQAARESIPQLEKFVAADPEDFASLVSLAKSLASDDRQNEAVKLLRAAHHRQPAATQISGLLAELYLRQYDLAAAADVLEASPLDERADILLWRSHGMYADATQDWERAQNCLARAAHDSPDDLASAYKLGLALEALGRHAEAERQLAQAARLERFQTAMIRFGRERERPAATLAPQAVELARLLVELGRPSEALPWLDQVLKWIPENAEASALRAQVAAAHSTGAGPAAPADALSGNANVAAWRPTTRPVERSHLASPESRIVLRDCHREAGLTFNYFNGASGSKYLLETLGGGVAVLDYDGDGWPDLYFAQGAPIPPLADDSRHEDRLFRNLGDGTFVDVTSAAGLGDRRYSHGCAAGDIDNDGDPDLIVANWGETAVYLNSGDGTFVECSQTMGIAGERWSSSLALADFDRDGNLDLYVVTYMLEPLRTCKTDDGRAGTCHPGNYSAELDVLYRNLGDGTFRDESESAGILAPGGKGLGVLVSDLDQDGWPEIYVANDGTANFLFKNTGVVGNRTRFVELGMISGAAVSGDGLAQGSMGIAGGDLNGDGMIDFYVTNFYFEGSALYLNRGAMTFVDAIREAGLYEPTRPMLGFGTQAADFDLDGRLDLLAVNGHIDDFRFRGEPWQMPAQLFWNAGEGRFVNLSAKAGEFFTEKALGRAVARLDWDRDGKPDAVVTFLDRPAALLRNETTSAGHSLTVELHGVESNRDAIGARITLHANGLKQVVEICGGDGYMASNERRQVLGLGGQSYADLVEVQWPSGRVQQWRNVPDGVFRAIEGEE